MNDLPEFLVNVTKEIDPIFDRFNSAREAYIDLFGDEDDLHEYISTWDYGDKEFLELSKKIENCVKLKKRYKNVYLTIFDRMFHKIKYIINDYDE